MIKISKNSHFILPKCIARNSTTVKVVCIKIFSIVRFSKMHSAAMCIGIKSFELNEKEEMEVMIHV